LGCFLIDVCYDYRVAVLTKPIGNGGTDARGCTCYQSDSPDDVVGVFLGCECHVNNLQLVLNGSLAAAIPIEAVYKKPIEIHGKHATINSATIKAPR
jgi:hypothetical protein